MSFTDEDLKRLKEYADRSGYTIMMPLSEGNYEGTFDLKALLARLEAAEDALNKARPFFDMHPTRIGNESPSGTHVFTDAYWKWFKSSGKAEGK